MRVAARLADGADVAKVEVEGAEVGGCRTQGVGGVGGVPWARQVLGGGEFGAGEGPARAAVSGQLPPRCGGG